MGTPIDQSWKQTLSDLGANQREIDFLSSWDATGDDLVFYCRILYAQDRRGVREAYNRKRRASMRARRKADPSLRVRNAVSARMWAALKGRSDGKLSSRLGYSLQDLMQRLESKFADGMSWDNYGRWHVDHIKPCAKFDLTDPVQFSECWALSNLQPLWAEDNIKKGAKYASAS